VTVAPTTSRRLQPAAKLKIGELLVREQVLSAEQLQKALEVQRATGRRLGRVLIEQGFLTERALSLMVSQQLGLHFADLRADALDIALCRQLPEVQARRLRALPLRDSPKAMLVAVSDPTELTLIDELERFLKRPVELVVVEETKLLAAVDKVYRDTEKISALTRELQQELSTVNSALDMQQSLAAGADDAPVVRLLQSLLEDGVRMRASDVHIEPQDKKLVVRLRIDGTLHAQTESDLRIAPALILRLKLVAGLDISEKRLPQDGRFVAQVSGVPVDIRISTLPTQYGESAVLRLLVRSSQLLGLDRIGLPAPMVAKVRAATERTSGMVLVTGPTGSGKTTTLYAMLSELNRPDCKAITVEDPIEYRLPGLNQVQINEKIGLTFASVLRAVLRQDPDVILVGEMRDRDTVETGLRAAMTGHMVLSTLHTNDAASTPVRLLDMGAAPYLVALSLQIVIAQRLVRTICASCAEEVVPSERERAFIAMHLGHHGVPARLRAGRGCSQCNGSGFSGRQGVYEMFEMTEDLADALGKSESGAFVAQAREQMGEATLPRQALDLALAGRTHVQEAMKLAARQGSEG
jgi:MSHA biogenesis protein MshE